MNPNLSLRNVAIYHSRVAESKKCVYVGNHRAGSTTIKVLMHVMEGGEIPVSADGTWDDIHRTGITLSCLLPEKVVEIALSPEWFWFTFVRNPYTRLVSAFYAKIIPGPRMPEGGWYEYVRCRVRRNGVLTFESFVEYVQWAFKENFPDGSRERDDHWGIQSRILLLDLLPYDFIGRFEYFETGIRLVLDKLGALDLMPLAMQNHSVTSEKGSKFVYDERLAKIVYEVYRQDFERFGYEKDSWQQLRGP